MEREVEVFIDLDDNARLVGRLWSRSIKGRESASFEYDETWLNSGATFENQRLSSKELKCYRPPQLPL
jgi:hypothetical protein